MATVLVVNRTRLNAEALASAFTEQEQATLVAASAAEARSRARKVTPDIALLELDLAIGLKLVRDLFQDHPALIVFIYGSSDDDRELAAWAEAGASRIVMRTVPLTDLVRCVCDATRAEATADRSKAVVHHPAGLRRLIRMKPAGAAADLTQRERDVLSLIAAGLSNREVAEMLSLELPTVKNHIQHLMRKLGVHRRADAARYWHESQAGERADDRAGASSWLDDGHDVGFARSNR